MGATVKLALSFALAVSLSLGLGACASASDPAENATVNEELANSQNETDESVSTDESSSSETEQADDGKLIYLVEGARVQQPAPAPRETGNRTINRLFSLLGDYAPVKLAAIVVAVVVAVVLLIRGTMRY